MNDFDSNGYCIVRNAISNEIRDFVTQYALFDEMQDFCSESMVGSKQVPNAHSKYADPAMEVMLLSLHKVMEENTQLKLFPTYSYYRVYRPGDILSPHTDRPSCEISATMCFNYSYENYSWPIFIEGNEINLFPGDMAIYKGCDLIHWRDELKPPNENDWHVQGFFHYVNSNGSNSSYKFDKRQSIGEKKSASVGKKYIQFLK